jgi:hypothetical protein
MEKDKKRIYIAGKVEDENKDIRNLATDLEEHGHSITYKWWEEDIKKPYLDKENVNNSIAASLEMEKGVRMSDVFILVPTPNILGAAVEFGVAIGDDKDRELLVIVDENTRQSIFYANPKVICLNSLKEIRRCRWF